MEIDLKNKSYKLFFEEDALITLKARLSTTLSSLIQIEGTTFAHIVTPIDIKIILTKSKRVFYLQKKFKKSCEKL